MTYTAKTQLITERDATLKKQFDARITQAPQKVFRFNFDALSDLGERSTIHIASLPLNSYLTGIQYKNNFDSGVEIRINSTLTGTPLINSTKENTVNQPLFGMFADNCDIYITVVSGIIKKGQTISGVITFC